MTSLSLIFMGTPEFAVPTLAALQASEHRISAVYTAPPKPAGRGQKERRSAVHLFADAHGLTVETPATLKSEESQARFAAHDADAAVVAAYGLLLPEAVLRAPRFGCLNIHPSLLPRWRGAAPIQRAVMEGDTETGIVIMQMDKGLDTGDMLRVKRVALPAEWNAGQLHDCLAAQAGELVLETLDACAAGILSPLRQPEDGVRYAAKLTKEEARIDWALDAATLLNRIRGLAPAPGAYFYHNEEPIKVLAAESSTAHTHATPGAVTDTRLSVQCGRGLLRPTLVQRPGKRPMTTEALLLGHPIPLGTVLS